MYPQVNAKYCSLCITFMQLKLILALEYLSPLQQSGEKKRSLFPAQPQWGLVLLVSSEVTYPKAFLR